MPLAHHALPAVTPQEGEARESSLVKDKEEIERLISVFEGLINRFTKTQRHITTFDEINGGYMPGFN